MIGAALQKAVYAALAGNSPAIAGGRVYDQVPRDPTFPYVTIGDEQLIDDSNSCSDAVEAYADVHIWSRPAGGSKLEAKDLAADVIERLATQITVIGFANNLGLLETQRAFRDPDGKTEHVVLTFKYLIAEA